MTRTRNLSDLLDANGDVVSTAFDNASIPFSSVTSTPTTLSGYGITDAATSASPTFTGNATFDSSTLYVDATNNRVGIGTTGPGVDLEVLNSSGNCAVKVVGNGGQAQLQLDGGTSGSPYYIYNPASGGLIFQDDSTERMRINSSGNVGIGTNSPNAKLMVSHGNNAPNSSGNMTNGSVFSNSGTLSALQVGSASSYSYLNSAYSNNSGVGVDMRFYIGGGSERMRLETDGDLHADGDVIAYSTTISDIRLKDNIVGINNALAKVSQLNGYTFEYKADGKISAGVIAQEVEAVLPEAVSEKQLPLKTDDDQEYKVVNYDALHGLLIEAIKELTARVEELEAK